VRRTFSGATLRPVNAKDTADSFARILEGYGTLCASVRVRCLGGENTVGQINNRGTENS
jgi:hypothetical protein